VRLSLVFHVATAELVVRSDDGFEGAWGVRWFCLVGFLVGVALGGSQALTSTAIMVNSTPPFLVQLRYWCMDQGGCH